MFTGLIEELGTLVERKGVGSSLRLLIKAERVFSGLDNSQNGLKIDDSIALDGCCQTVHALDAPFFEVTAVAETLKKTTLGSLKIGDRINLERAAMLSSRMGGHLVQGHVDTVAEVVDLRSLVGSWELYVKVPDGFERFLIPIGSVCLNGVSLTVAEISGQILKTAIIPHTYTMTNVHSLKAGVNVNLECDMIAKMVEQFVRLSIQPKAS